MLPLLFVDVLPGKKKNKRHTCFLFVYKKLSSRFIWAYKKFIWALWHRNISKKVIMSLCDSLLFKMCHIEVMYLSYCHVTVWRILNLNMTVWHIHNLNVTLFGGQSVTKTNHSRLWFHYDDDRKLNVNYHTKTLNLPCNLFNNTNNALITVIHFLKGG